MAHIPTETENQAPIGEDAVAQALFAADYYGDPWADLPESDSDKSPYLYSKADYLKFASAAMVAHKAALIEAGYAIVPVLPTEAMIDAVNVDVWGSCGADHYPEPAEVWRAMVGAAK